MQCWSMYIWNNVHIHKWVQRTSNSLVLVSTSMSNCSFKSASSVRWFVINKTFFSGVSGKLNRRQRRRRADSTEGFKQLWFVCICLNIIFAFSPRIILYLCQYVFCIFINNNFVFVSRTHLFIFAAQKVDNDSVFVSTLYLYHICVFTIIVG